MSASSDTKSEGKNTQAGKERWIVSLQHPEHPIARYLAHEYPRKLYIILIILDTNCFTSFHTSVLAIYFQFSSADTAEQEPTSPRQRYSRSSSQIDKDVLLGSDLAKAHTAIAKKYSLPPRARKDIPQVESRARTRSADNEVQEAYDNPAISMETSDEATPRKKLSLTNRLESPFYTAGTESSTKDSTPPLPSAKARYSKAKKGEVPDLNANDLPAVKGELQRKGSIVLVSKSQTGETCFQVKTPGDYKKKARKDKIESSEEFNV